MNSDGVNIRLGHVLYLVILLGALGLRFINLGEFPLTNLEAMGALEAVRSTPYASGFFPESFATIPQPAYEILTRGLFQIFGAENIFARMVPSLAGLLLVLTPLLARERIGFGHSLLMGFLLAISPIFVTISRTASGTSLAALGLMAFLMSVIGQPGIQNKSTYLIAGVGFGLALASGPYAIFPLISLALAFLVYKLRRSKMQLGVEKTAWNAEALRPILCVAAIAVFTFTTGIGWSMQGFSRFFESFAFWIQGWSVGSPFSGLTLLVILLTYMPTLVFLGILGVWSSLRQRDEIGNVASMMAVFGFALSMVYPHRHPHDLLWVALPLAFVGSKYLFNFVQQFLDRRVTAWVLALGLILITLSFMAYLQMSSKASQTLPVDIFDAWQTPFLFLTLMFVIVSFFGLGWNWISAKLSVILAFLCIALIFSLSALWSLNFASQVYTANELWRSEVPSQGLQLLLDTLETTSSSSKGAEEGLNVEIIGEAPAYLLWTLREYRPQSQSVAEDGQASPVVLVEVDQRELKLQADYVGQTLAIGEKWGWRSALPPDFLKWWIKRDPVTLSSEWLILIRQDIALLIGP
jgi:hypothetical protein